jgi:hypothetical protein
MQRYGSMDVGSQLPLDLPCPAECLVKFGSQLLRACGIACPRQCQCRHGSYAAVRASFSAQVGVGTGLRNMPYPFDLRCAVRSRRAKPCLPKAENYPPWHFSRM